MAKPPRHGVIKTSTMKPAHMKQHLDLMTEHLQITKDYGSHGIAYSSQGGLTGSGMSGGAGGADYTTTNEGLVGDSDSQGPTGY
jgi:hypothetical protein